MTQRNKKSAPPMQYRLLDENHNSSSNIKSLRYYPDLNENRIEGILFSIIALSLCKGVGFHSICELFDTGIIDELWETPTEQHQAIFSNLSISKRINFSDITEQRKNIYANAKKIVDDLKAQSISFIPIGSKSYPASLLNLNIPPRWVFVRGNILALHANSIVALVGTRSATMAGLKLAYQCAGELAKRNVVVLSGLAKGIDEHSHQGAVAVYGQSIAVLGYGLFAENVTHDMSLVEKMINCDGAIVSEYLPFDIPSRAGFLRRNELQAALSNVVIPVECPDLDSGTGATIRRALNIKTPVMGIYSEPELNESLSATKRNLEKLGLPVFKVRSENSKDFWDELKRIMPNHNWSIDPKPNQERLFRNLIKQVVSIKRDLSIDTDVIDRFANELKKIIAD
jgi:DNA processing protein